MKRFLLTMVALFALVIMANKTFAQSTTPVVGASYDYSVSGLAADDTYEFSLSTSTTTANAGTVSATTDGTLTGTVSAGGSTATETITWNDTNTSYFWITVTDDGTSCINMRYITITPQENVFDAEVTALGTSTQTTYPSWESAGANANDCHVFLNADFSTSTADDGESYVFFRINVVSTTTDNINDSSNTWDIDGFTIGGVTPTATNYWVNAVDNGTTIPTGLSHDDNVLVRLTVTNAPAGYSITATLDASENEGNDGVSDVDGTSGDNQTTFTLDAYPDLSGISFN